MFFLDIISGSLLNKFKARFSPNPEQQGYFFYKNKSASGVPCSNDQYHTYVSDFESLVKRVRRFMVVWFFFCILILFFMVFLAGKLDISDSYTKAFALIVLFLPLPYIFKKCRASYKRPYQLYDGAISNHGKRSKRDTGDAHLNGFSNIYVGLLLFFCILAFNDYYHLEKADQSMSVLWSVVAVFIVGLYVLIRKLRISIRYGLATNNRLTFAGTTPSNPSRVKLVPTIWVKHNPITIVIFIALLALFVLTIVTSLFFLPALLILSLVNIYHWVHNIEKFASSDSNPGMVISVNPPLAAVATDVGKWGRQEYPIIKVIKYKTNNSINVGDRIGTVGTYGTDWAFSRSKRKEKPYWRDFDPIPLSYATDNEIEISQAMERYSVEGWRNLQVGLRQLEKPYRKGLHRITTDKSGWVE